MCDILQLCATFIRMSAGGRDHASQKELLQGLDPSLRNTYQNLRNSFPQADDGVIMAVLENCGGAAFRSADIYADP